MPKQPIAIPYGLRETLQRGLTHYKIIFLSAGTGWGKSTAVTKLLEKQNAAYLSLRKKPLPGYFPKERIVALDDFQELPPQAEQQFQEILRKSQRGQRFILISRGPMPAYLSLYEATGALLQLGSDDLALDIDKAWDLLLQFRAGIVERNVARLLPNIDAMRCRLSLLDESAFASVWYSEQSPNEGVFYGMERYRYLTKARCYIKHREHHAALLLLGRMLDYTRRYARPLDMLETLILISICRYRMENEDWREHFTRALELGAKYGYVAVFSREGAALLPLLEHYDHRAVSPDYWEKILSAAVLQAGFYSQYLQPLDNPLTCLTQTETMILRLISQDKSNEEIGSLLDIKLPTVKTHVRNLFKKLKVSSRAEAQKAAKRLGLVGRDGA